MLSSGSWDNFSLQQNFFILFVTIRKKYSLKVDPRCTDFLDCKGFHRNFFFFKFSKRKRKKKTFRLSYVWTSSKPKEWSFHPAWQPINSFTSPSSTWVGMKCRCQTRGVSSEQSVTWPWANWPWRQEPFTKWWHSCGNLPKLVRQLHTRMGRYGSGYFFWELLF